MPQEWNPQLTVATLSKLFPIVFVHMHEQAQESECAPKMKVTDNVQNFGHNYDRIPPSESLRLELCSYELEFQKLIVQHLLKISTTLYLLWIFIPL